MSFPVKDSPLTLKRKCGIVVRTGRIPTMPSMKKLSLCPVEVLQASKPAVSRVSQPACLSPLERAPDFCSPPIGTSPTLPVWKPLLRPTLPLNLAFSLQHYLRVFV
jgi:hypothetical protein